MKNRNSTVASVVSVASGIVNDPRFATLATLATVLFVKMPIRYQLPKWKHFIFVEKCFPKIIPEGFVFITLLLPLNPKRIHLIPLTWRK